jgi:hypothetical protein
MSSVRDLSLGVKMVPQFDYESLVAEAGINLPFHIMLTGSQRVGLTVYLRQKSPTIRASFHQVPGVPGKTGWKTVHQEALPYIVTLVAKESKDLDDMA